MPLHLYGVVRADQPVPHVRGVGDPPADVRSVVWQDIAALTSEPPGSAPTDDDAVTHLDVLTAALAYGPVLPLRFGTTAPDDDAVRTELLAAAAGDLRARLDTLDGLVEMRVELDFPEDDLLREVLAAEPDLRSLAGGDLDQRVRLGEAVANGVASICRQRGEDLLGPLADSAVRTRRLEATEPHVDRWAFLIHLTRLPEVDSLVKTAADRAASVDYVGPMPAYSFLDEPLEEVRPRWGWE